MCRGLIIISKWKMMHAKLPSRQRNCVLTNGSRWLAVCQTTSSSFFHNQLYIWTISCSQSMWHWVYHVYHLFCSSYNLGDLKVNCMLGNFSYFCCRLLTFFKIIFFKKFFQEHNQSIKRFGSRSGTHSVGPDLGPNCLQRLSADDTSCTYEPVFDPRVYDTESTMNTISFVAAITWGT